MTSHLMTAEPRAQDLAPGRIYCAKRTADGAKVTVRVSFSGVGFPLNPRHDLRNHSPDGFEWGYCGSGPAQLALAILADLVGDKCALDLYQDFKVTVLATITVAQWWMTEEFVREKLAELANYRAWHQETHGGQ